MDSGVRTVRSAGDRSGPYRRAVVWLLLEGDRRLVATGIIVAMTGILWGLVTVGAVAVGAGSSVASLFGSGLTAGVVTLLTIALSINQLILSRVFGSPDTLMDRLTGAREMRRRVEELAGHSSSPNDPAGFLGLLARTLRDRAEAALSASEPDAPGEFTTALEAIAAYGESIDAQLEAETDVSNVLGVIIGPGYANNMTAVRHVRTEYGSELPKEVQAQLDAVETLLEAVAVVRQFFKTLALQQDFAVLSRLLVYSGLSALLCSVSLTLVYGSGAVTLSESTLRAVVPLSFGVVVAPLALFAAFILRAATVAARTVSVGPFIPPSGR